MSGDPEVLRGECPDCGEPSILNFDTGESLLCDRCYTVEQFERDKREYADAMCEREAKP